MTQSANAAAGDIAFTHVSKYFGQFCAVDDLNLSIKSGEMVALLGKTGCGKSTIFNMVAGLMQPTKGTITVGGLDPFASFEDFRGKIAIVFQNDRLLPWRTAIQNVELGLEILDVSRAERRARAQQWLSAFGLAGHEKDYPHALSGGMRQRVSIARAFATDAALLLCDEPFSALDEITAGKLRLEFANLVRQNGKTAVLVTHSINEALQIGDRIVTLRRPAKIALDIAIPRDADESFKSDIRTRIQSVLAE